MQMYLVTLLLLYGSWCDSGSRVVVSGSRVIKFSHFLRYNAVYSHGSTLWTKSDFHYSHSGMSRSSKTLEAAAICSQLFH